MVEMVAGLYDQSLDAWARGYFVDTVGRETEKIRRYIQNQEAEDRRLDQLELTDQPPQQTDRKQK